MDHVSTTEGGEQRRRNGMSGMAMKVEKRLQHAYGQAACVPLSSRARAEGHEPAVDSVNVVECSRQLQRIAFAATEEALHAERGRGHV